MMNQFTLVDTLPVLREEFPVSAGFHHRVMLRPADKAFHKSCRFVHYLHHMVFLCHASKVDLLY